MRTAASISGSDSNNNSNNNNNALVDNKDTLEQNVINVVTNIAVYMKLLYAMTVTSNTYKGMVRDVSSHARVLQPVISAASLLTTYAFSLVPGSSVKPTNILDIPDTYFQGLSHTGVAAQYANALTSLKKAKALFTEVEASALSEDFQKALIENLKKYSDKAPGDRFHDLFKIWIDLFINASNLTEARRFLSATQKLLSPHFIQTKDLTAALTNIANGKKVNHDTPTDYMTLTIRGEYMTIFDALGNRPIHQVEFRPNEITTISHINLQMGELRSQIFQQLIEIEKLNTPDPTVQLITKERAVSRIYRTFFETLNIFGSLHKPVYLAAQNNADNDSQTNIRLHAALLQTVLLTLADEKKDPNKRQERCKMHWEKQGQEGEPFADLFEFFKDKNKSATFTFAEAMRELEPLSSKNDLKNAKNPTLYVPEELKKLILAYLETKIDLAFAHQLLIRITEYIEGLGASLRKSINEYGDQKVITDEVKDPKSTLEFLAEAMNFATSPAVKQFLKNMSLVSETKAAANNNASSKETDAGAENKAAANASASSGAAASSAVAPASPIQAGASSSAPATVVSLSGARSPKNSTHVSEEKNGAQQKKNSSH